MYKCLVKKTSAETASTSDNGQTGAHSPRNHKQIDTYFSLSTQNPLTSNANVHNFIIHGY